MSVILKQSFWSTIIIYIGVLLGFVNSVILFPKYLSTEQIGLIRQIISAAIILIPITTFGASATYVKFYPSFKDDKNKKNEFFSFQLFIILISYSIVCLIINFFYEDIKSLFTQKSEIFFQYFDLLFLILFIMSVSSLFESYLRARYHTILNNIINGVSNRFFTGITVILLSYAFIDFNTLINLQVYIYLLGVIILIYYSIRKDKISIQTSFISIKKSFKKILDFSAFSFLGSFSNIIVLNVDVLMVTSILGLSDTGIYTTAFYIGMIIEIPRRAISQISIPFISEQVNNKNFEKIEKNYKDVSLHQMLIGVLFIILIFINLQNIYNLLPNSKNFISGMDVVYIIALSKLIMMSFSYSSELINFSKYYKFTVVTIIILAFLTISLNLILIPKFGMLGAAYASLISILVFNLIKFIFIKIKMDITPFSINSIKIIVIGIIVYYFSDFIPDLDSPFLDIIIKSVITSLVYIIIVITLKISPELNSIILKNVTKK